ncbi:(11Z)-hexadec-11-enoyl-CoA conjugase-like [Nylanderia fulva]|uniref:(11Z)-hexadec-11-enoyl-CoA conjugase-like n=1 Tax=Nylanderia fulva TaxID=613905 RepID=UPI0010FB8CCC|nr:(11Z)-hexadec-11-enoyl-CoA conjugase-like [Nylanderia fulva]
MTTGHIYGWVRDHRVHHKFTDTDADPYNARKGFFFSHIGWILVHKHPDVISKGAMIDLSDLKQDCLVVFQRKYDGHSLFCRSKFNLKNICIYCLFNFNGFVSFIYTFFRWYRYLMLFCCFIIPTLIPWWVWSENLWCAWHLNMTRCVINLHTILSINSAAHMWGVKPYDKSISPTENAVVSFISCGEGWHNYHHVFPWDYKAAELGNYKLNIATAFIDFFAYLGLAYDLKTASAKIVKKRALRNSEIN